MIDEDKFFEPREAKSVTVPWTIFPFIIVLCLVIGFVGGYFTWGREEVSDSLAETTTESTEPEKNSAEEITEDPADGPDTLVVEIPFAPIYIVQNGTFADTRHLNNCIASLEKAGYPAVTEELERLTRVFTTTHLSREEAEARAGEMTEKNFDTYIKNIDHLQGGNFVIEAKDEQEFVLLTNIAAFVEDLYRILSLETVEPDSIEILPFIERTTQERFDIIYNEIASIYAVFETKGLQSEQYRTEIAWRLMNLMIDINLTQ